MSSNLYKARAEFYKLRSLVSRNIKIYFKDKMTFFVSLITPLILVILFLTFLKDVYDDTIIDSLPQGMEISKKLINAFSGGWLFSSIISVSTVTVAFCSNIHVLDKINKSFTDFSITPVKRPTLLASYVISDFLTTLLICLTVMLVSFVYLAIVGFYLSFGDIVMLLLSTMIMSAFGSLLASLAGMFISSQGALSGISSCVSALYGFISGAYMPISQFGAGMKNFVSLLPGTYGTVLIRKYYMRGILRHLEEVEHIPAEIVSSLNKAFDGQMSAFGTDIPIWACYLIISLSCVALFLLLLAVAALLSKHKPRSKKQSRRKK